MAGEHEKRRKVERRPDAEMSFHLPRPGRRLAALTSSALALPGIAGSASADTPIERAEGSYAFSYYLEDDLSRNKFESTIGSRERYEVLTHQLRFDLPVAERLDLGVQLLYEEMSGASPWYVVPGSTGEPLQVMSGATIEDERFDMTVDADFYMDKGKDTFSGGISTEKDYFSLHAGIGSDRNYNDKNTTASTAASFSYDWIDPTDSDDFNTRPSDEEKWSIDLFAGLSQILTRSTVGQITINYKHSDGYLSDPYKAIQNLDGGFGLLSDSRPDTKDQVSILARLRQHVEPLNASVHFDYRFYADSFDITSHTVDLAWYQSVMDFITITPGVRYYSQSKADFYETVLPVGIIPKERSSDFRLSPYGALSLRMKMEIELQEIWRYDAPGWLRAVGVGDGLDLIAALSYERYLSDGDYALISVDEQDEAPGLVKFQVFAVTLSGRF
jgi:Protein of unknown function (DUF3570)